MVGVWGLPAVTIPSKHIIDNARRKYNASKLVLSDRSCPRPIVPVCEELPQQRRLRLNKRAKSQYLQVRFMTANIGRMTGNTLQADIKDRRKIMTACVQETHWKGSKVKDNVDGFKLYYHGICRAINGI